MDYQWLNAMWKICPEIVFELAAVSDTPLTIVYPRGKYLAEGVCARG